MDPLHSMSLFVTNVYFLNPRLRLLTVSFLTISSSHTLGHEDMVLRNNVYECVLLSHRHCSKNEVFN